ncbi:unnamed protein product [Acanthoscelides obtectus]|uniref:Uncharacterized protein n=1 Tax=Acanthoscelides obtectus TaxID=200917 RepID=A0A9P0PEK0_ACAOB|nr:unnamed protein product [Acanthoscelides obtectus]CAK1623726.1 hypothetical protein AOBTE_LOCUS2137 [Acanthoscelides obtectus]
MDKDKENSSKNDTKDDFEASLSLINYYREENAKMVAVLEKTGLAEAERSLYSKSLQNMVESICKEENKYARTTTNMSRAEMIRKHSNYVSKIRICIRMYSNLNNVLLKEISFMRGKIQKSKETVSDLNVSLEKLQQLEQTSIKYEAEVSKFESRLLTASTETT